VKVIGKDGTSSLLQEVFKTKNEIITKYRKEQLEKETFIH